MHTLYSASRWRVHWMVFIMSMLLMLVVPSFANAPSEELDPNDFKKMDFDVEKLVAYHSAYPVRATSGHSRNAYVMIHYEGTPNDDLYVLGTQIVIRSIKDSGTKQDIVIVCADNVRESSKEIFLKEGAKIKIVPNIPNPYKATQQSRRTYKARFEFTFNKLYMWNLLEYERVVYMDADNLVTRNMDEMFLCGHYCITFFNPLYFHTGMMVVKPDADKFKQLLTNLLTLASFSYDGADQGFLTAEFPALESAPLFNAKDILSSPNPVPSEEPIMRFSMEYNMNSVFFYPYYSWYFYRRANLPFSYAGNNDHENLPVASLDYCIGPLFKPWNWLPFIFFYTVTYWDAIRMQDPTIDFSSLSSIVFVLFTLVATCAAASFGARTGGKGLNAIRTVTRNILFTFSAKLIGVTLGLTTFVTSIIFVTRIPLIIPPVYAWPLIYTTIILTFYTFLHLFAIAVAPVGPPTPSALPFGTTLSDMRALLLSGSTYHIVSAAKQKSAKGMHVSLPAVANAVDDSDLSEFDDEIEAGTRHDVGHLDANGTRTARVGSNGYAAINAIGANTPGVLSSNIDNSSLRNGISFSATILPILICVLQIYICRIASWHFHFVEKLFLFAFTLMGLVAAFMYSFQRVALLAAGAPEVGSVIELK